ncbi:MAG: hypothetical protein ABW179_09305, partial [Methylobacterium sp.]
LANEARALIERTNFFKLDTASAPSDSEGRDVRSLQRRVQGLVHEGVGSDRKATLAGKPHEPGQNDHSGFERLSA